MIITRIAIMSAALFALCAGAAADNSISTISPGVDKPADRLPTDIRRVTMIVRDLENSLKLYRDVMGLAVNYDAVLPMSGVALPAGEPGAKARLVLLNGNDAFVGWIGLMQWLDPPLPEPGPYARRMGVGGHVVVTNTENVERRCAEASRVPGVTMTAPVRLQEYPGRNGAPPIRVRGCNFFDPDGTLIELNQMLAGTATAPAVTVEACNKPVYMVVSGPTHDRDRMMAYARAIAESGLYQRLGGYYVNRPRALETFEGSLPASYSTLIVRFPCLANARAFWYSKEYQEGIKPLRLSPPAGEYSVSVYEEMPLREDMKGKVGDGAYRVEFSTEGIVRIGEK